MSIEKNRKMRVSLCYLVSFVGMVWYITPLMASGSDRSGLSRRATELPKVGELPDRGTPSKISGVRAPRNSELYSFSGTDEALLEKTINDGIAQLLKLSRQFKSNQNRGEIWLRLAELYVEKAQFIEYQQQNEIDRKLRAFQAKEIFVRPKLDLSQSNKYHRNAIALHERFLKEFSNDPKIDQVLFFLGYNHFELHESTQGAEYYQRLATQFPKSPYVGEINFALGEYYFDGENWAQAAQSYQKVVQNKRARVYLFSLYKLAWTYYRLGEYSKALKTMESALVKSQNLNPGEDLAGRKSVNHIRLAEEALNDLVFIYVEAGDYKKATSYFRRYVPNGRLHAYIEKLGDYYEQRGTRAAVRYLFRYLIDADRSGPKAFDYQYRIVKEYTFAADLTTFKNELKRWIQDYGPQSSWAAQQSDSKIVADATDLQEKTLRNFILQTHRTAQKTRAQLTQNLAQEGYEMYIQNFGKSKNSGEIRFFYGELLYDLKSYGAAALQYTWVVENDPKNPYREQAIINLITSSEQELPNDEAVKNKVGHRTDPVELDPSVKVFEKGALGYLKEYPQGKKTLEVRFRLARLYYLFNHFDLALDHFQQVVEQSPKSELGEYAANLILDIYNIRKDYAGLQTRARKLLLVSGLRDSKVGEQVRSILENAAFKNAQELESSKKYLESARAYENFASKNSKSKWAQAARFNAATQYVRALKVKQALPLFLRVASDLSGQELAPLARGERARLYQEMGSYKAAAREYEQFVSQFPKHKNAASSAFNAALLYESLKFYPQAIQNYEKYYSLEKNFDRVEGLFQIGEIWYKRKQFAKAIPYLERYLSENPRKPEHVMEAHYKNTKSWQMRRNISQSKIWMDKTLAVQKRLARSNPDLGRNYAAEFRFEMAQKLFDEVGSVKIPKDSDSQAKAFKEKIKKLNILNDELAQVIRLADPDFIVASLFTLGQAWDLIGDSVAQAPLPQGLGANDIKDYRSKLFEASKEYREKAIESYSNAVSKARQLEAYNSWYSRATQRLALIRPNSSNLTHDRPMVLMRIDWMEL